MNGIIEYSFQRVYCLSIMNNNSKLNLTVSRDVSRIVRREVFRAGAVPGIKKSGSKFALS